VAKKTKQVKQTEVMFKGKPTTRGIKMTKGAYRILNTGNRKVFVGSLIDTINYEGKRIALFSVPK
jgi:hypothetical protein